MEILYDSIIFSFAIILSTFLFKFLEWAWVRPKRLEKQLREQGYFGNSYKPLIGDLLEMAHSIFEAKRLQPFENFSNDISPRILPFLHKTITRHGKKSYIWIGPKPAVIISEPEMIKEMLADYHTFVKPYNPAGNEIVKGLVFTEADKWHMHKKIINPAFHLEKLKLKLPEMYETINERLEKWEKVVKAEGTEVDVWPDINILTSDAIAKVAFGSNFQQGRNIFENLAVLAKHVTDLGTLLFFPPYWMFPTISKRRIQRKSNEVKELVRKVVEKRMEEMTKGDGGGAETSDLLGVLLESNLKEMRSGGVDKGMSIDDVVEECKLFYFAGQESTTSMIGWTLILMGKHLEWQERARAEVMHVFGLGPIQTKDFYKLNQLKIINMIFHESLRLYAPLNIIYRSIIKDSQLGKTTLPGGVDVMVSLLSLHVDKDLWGEDALEFNPERFKDGTIKASKIPGAYFPFGGGPRVCIGQNFAMVEAKIAISAILQRFSFQLSPSYQHSPFWNMTVRSPNANLILRRL